ncbi:hypothetical protein [Thermomonospora catenispora]|nr:hypothetical protein [Thermomonospora catenispora]
MFRGPGDDPLARRAGHRAGVAAAMVSSFRDLREEHVAAHSGCCSRRV